MKFDPEVLAAHAQFGGNLEDMQRRYDAHPMTTLRDTAENATAGVPVGLVRSAQSYRDCQPNAVAGGSKAQMMYFVEDAKADIATLLSELDTARAEIERLRAALAKIDEIRNSIIGYQTVNWSAHVYPLVAALHEAGFDGVGYEKARAEAETQVEYITSLSSALTAAQERIAELERDRHKVHELSATLRDKSTWNLPIQEAAQEIVLLSSPLPDPNAEPTNSPLSPAVKEPK